MRKIALIVFMLVLLTAAMAAHAQEQDTAVDELIPVQFPAVAAPEVFDRGAQAFDAQNYERAVLDFSLFILLNPTFGEAYAARAESYLRIGSDDDALTDLSTALAFPIQSKDYTASLYLMRGNIYNTQQREEEALSDYSESLKLSPSAEGYFNRGLIYMTRSNFDLARDDFSGAIELNAQDPTLYLYRAYLNTQLGDSAAAAQDYFDWIRGIRQDVQEHDPLVPGKPVTVDIKGGLIQLLPFEGKAGQIVNAAAVNADGSQTDPLMVLVTADEGKPLAANDDDGVDPSAVIAGYELPADGNYILLVSHSLSAAEGSVVVLLNLE